MRPAVGSIDPNAANAAAHPKVTSAAALIRAAIDGAPGSNTDPIRATANAAIAWQELGLLHRAINEFDDARRCFEKSLTLLDRVSQSDSRHSRILHAKRETFFRLAELDHVLGNHANARRGYEKSLQIDDLLGHDDPVGEHTTRELLGRL